MKTKYYIAFGIIAVSLLISSCSDSDPCENKICPDGFSVVENGDNCDCVDDGSADPCITITCPAGFTEMILDGNCTCVDNSTGDNVIGKAGFINGNETWTADNIYSLTGKVVVNDGVTLTIEPGTIIKANEGTGSLASALIVARNGKLNACGTANQPIIFTSSLDNITIGQTSGTNLDETQSALWGGLIILGNAPGSFEGDVVEFQIEGIPADDSFGLYGGNDPSDDSGTLCYLSIRHGGALIGENNEINGLTLGCVGNGTSINNIEVVANLDDGIEVFGGTVDLNNALVWAQGDDAFDVDQGYSGTLRNFISIAGIESDHALEIDGPEGSAQGSFNFINGTCKGLVSEMADFRDGAIGSVTETVFFNFNADGDLELDDDATSINFTNSDLILTSIEFVDSRSVSEICNDNSEVGDDVAFDVQMEADNKSVSVASKGADTSVFTWTYASSKGVLDF